MPAIEQSCGTNASGGSALRKRPSRWWPAPGRFVAWPDQRQLLHQRSLCAQKHRPAEPPRTRTAEVFGKRLADIARQWQPIDPRALAVDYQLARPPVDVIERQPGDLARSQPASRSEEHTSELQS